MRYADLADRVTALLPADGSPTPLLSFDVFDTLVRRRCSRAAVHDRVLAEMTAQLAFRGLRSAASIHEARHLAVQTLCARAVDAGLEPEFHVGDLYQRVLERCVGVGLADDERADLAADLTEFELQCEIRACRPIPGIVQQVRTLRERVERMVFVSDMYLGGRNVARILEAHGYDGLFDAGYASGDSKLYKASGRAFEQLMIDEGVGPSDVVHIGDHPIADDRAPSRLGIRTIRIVDPSLDRARLRDSIDHPHGVAGTAIALSAWTEIGAPVPADPVIRYGRTVVGPIFAGFVHSVIEQAIADRVDAVYFLSRDGYVPMQMYEAATRSSWSRARTAPPARYLVISRRPTVSAIMKEGLSIKALMSARNQLVASKRTVRNTLISLGIDGVVIDTVSRDHLLDPDHAFDDALLQHPSLLSTLNDVRLTKEARRAGGEAHQLLIDYLRQEGFLSYARVGIVDIGWGGTIQDQLHDAFQHVVGAPEIRGYYFGGNRSLYDRRTPDNRMTPIVSSVYSPSRSLFLGNSATFAAVGLIEEAARATHGTCTGYERDADVIRPVVKADDLRQGEVAGEETLARLQAGMVEYASAFFDGVDFLIASTEATLALARHALQRMVFFPDPAEIQFWRELTHTNDVGGLFEITENLLPNAQPWWRRPIHWKQKTRGSMWTHGAVRYLLGVPGMIAYQPAWVTAYARRNQRDHNLASWTTALTQPHERRRRASAPAAEPQATPTTQLYDRLVARATSPIGPSADDTTSILDPIVTAGVAASTLVSRVVPPRVRRGVPVVNDGLPVATMLRRHVAMWLSTPLVRLSFRSDRPSLLASKVLRRVLRC